MNCKLNNVWLKYPSRRQVNMFTCHCFVLYWQSPLRRYAHARMAVQQWDLLKLPLEKVLVRLDNYVVQFWKSDECLISI